ncbi:hypothetical protein MMC06_000160 [Schaereria dolodes]|nr:hypothetical protein [Schaereria dolodes]
MSGLMNKVKAAMSGEKETHEAGVASNVNDDYDTGAGTGLGSSGTTGYNNSTTGNTGHHGAHNAGPHTSKLANEADPRVDSDLSGGRGNTGGLTGTTSQGYGSNTSGGLGREYDNTSGSTGQGFGSNTTGGVGQGADSTTGITGHHGSHNAGPHASKLANKADPRVDSDLST